jgi:hypothetical protein
VVKRVVVGSDGDLVSHCGHSPRDFMWSSKREIIVPEAGFFESKSFSIFPYAIENPKSLV